MEFLILIVVGYIVFILAISILPVTIIFKSISQKSVTAQTLIDLVYRDCIIYVYLANFTFASSIIGCLMSENHVLDYYTSMILSSMAYIFFCFVVVSLSFTGFLRLLTVLSKSEEVGIQLLGPDNVGVWIVRLIAVLVTLSFVSAMLLLQIPPIVFYILYYEESITVQGFQQKNPGTIFYFIPPALALSINLVCKISSVCIYPNDFRSKFSISLGSSISISSLLFFAGLLTFLDRLHRLVFFYPLAITAFGFLSPSYIIFNNDKMRNRLCHNLDFYRRCFCNFICKFKSDSSNSVYPIE